MGNDAKELLKPLPGYDEVSIHFDDCLRSDFSEVMLQTLNSQVVWVNPRFIGSEVGDEQEHLRIINPCVPGDGLFEDSEEDMETDMSFIGPRVEKHTGSSGPRLARQRTKMISIETLKPPPEEAQNITSATEPDESQYGTRNEVIVEVDEDDEDQDGDSFTEVSVRNSAGFSYRSLDWRWIGDRNELEEVVPLRRMTGDDEGGSEYDEGTLGRSDLFWPIMTEEERKMLGVPSQLDLIAEVAEDTDPSIANCSIVVHPPTPISDVSEATSAVVAGPSRYRWGPVVEPVTSNNGNVAADLSVEVIAEARPPRIPNSQDDVPQMASAGTSTTELEELAAAEFPQGLSLHRCTIT